MAFEEAEATAACPPVAGGRAAGEGEEASLRRGRRRLLAETVFARCIGATLSGVFLTALIRSLGGGTRELGVALAAGHVGSAGMLLANPILNRVGSRRAFCLVSLGAVRLLRMVIASLPLLLYLGMGREALLWPVVACVLVSALFGMAGEVSRRSWIADLVAPADRGSFFARRVMLGSVVNVAAMLAGGLFVDHFRRLPGGDPLAALSVIIGFGGMMGWIGWAILWRAPEPGMSLPRRPTGLVRSLVLPWLRPRFRPLILVAAANSLAIGICGGFFDLYMLKNLGMSVVWVAAVDVTGELAALAGAPFYGGWADRAGARRVLSVAMVVKGLFPALWLLVAPSVWPLAFVVVLVRTFNSAGQIAWLRLTLNLSPARNQAAFLAMHQTVAGAALAAGSLAGGMTAWLLESVNLGAVGPIEIVPLHVLFVISATLRLASVALVRLIREPRRLLRPPGRGRATDLSNSPEPPEGQ